MKPVEELCVNTIRFLSVDAIEKARSGHPGMPMGAASMAFALWSRVLKHCPSDPSWPDRDRFILSAGHGSMMLYALLHLFGYDLSLEEIKNFRQWGSKTPGHPEYGLTPGVEITTGPLGQGLASAVGMAASEKRLAAEFNHADFSMVDHYTYVLASDGDLMEGVASEAASLAGHLQLGKLICMYDNNRITIDGGTEIAFSENVERRFEAYGWQVLHVEDGNDLDAVEEALNKARQEHQKPSLLSVQTSIGYGSPGKQDKPESHGAPLGGEETAQTKRNMKWPEDEEFYIPKEVQEYLENIRKEREAQKVEWDHLMERYCREHPQKAEQWNEWHQRGVPAELVQDAELWQFNQSQATRASSGQVMQVLYRYFPNLVGGSADLNASVKTYIKEGGDFQADQPHGNNLAFGVREHAMAAFLSGMALHGGLRPFGSTFLVFFDYMKPAIRLAALMGIPVVYIFSHDSVAVGEDGPTHQPVEQLSNLRSIPNLHVLRPADGRETAAAWLHALRRTEGPTALVLSRQGLPQLSGTGKPVFQGGYVLKKESDENLDFILMASGSELSLILEVREKLEEKGYSVRAVSMVSWELFREQPEEYRRQVLPDNCRLRLAVEAAHPQGWEAFVGDQGQIVAIDDFGASAPGGEVMKMKNLSVENVVEKALNMLEAKT